MTPANNSIRIGVECRFAVDGTIDVRRVYIDKRWKTVSQGRQWIDQLGRHVLIMMPEQVVKEIRLRPDTLTWELLDSGSRGIRAV